MQNVDTTKYVIYADITAEGIVERPDVVGAIFGQTEGLLGSDLDLRDLHDRGVAEALLERRADLVVVGGLQTGHD